MDLQGMYQGKTKASLPPKFKFPKGFCVTRWTQRGKDQKDQVIVPE